MSKPKALVLRTSGTNCELETAHALELGGAEADVLHCARALEDPSRLDPYAILVLAGGFSFGDDLSAGRIWGSQLRGPLHEALAAHVRKGGLALGVCNGFQVLVESGIFEPDRSAEERSVALYANASSRYECRWVDLETRPSRCTWLEVGERFPVPVAHAEGRFVARDAARLEELVAAGQVPLVYCAEGDAEPTYPTNPNGSMGHVAGICDPTGQVLGLMPHPERNLHPWSHPTWTRRGARDEGEGALFYRRLVQAARA